MRVVISSSWRNTRALDGVINSFPEALRARIIGATPTVPHIFNPRLRYDEIRAWIRKNHYEGPWVALDDAKQEFPPALPRLVCCEPDVVWTMRLSSASTRRLTRFHRSGSIAGWRPAPLDLIHRRVRSAQ